QFSTLSLHDALPIFSFLPYHDVTVTWIHRIALAFDVFMLVLIGIFLTRAETSFFTAFWRTTLQHPLSFIVTTGVLAIVSFFSFLDRKSTRLNSSHVK